MYVHKLLFFALGFAPIEASSAIITALIQSSAATIGITIALATQGLIDYPAAGCFGF